MIYRGSRTDRNVSRTALAGVILACMVLSPWVSSADESATARPSFSAAELKIILSHGPWPTPIGSDPSNRASGKPEAIELGTVLFFDQRLSGSGTKACATCHVPERNWTDNLSRGVGMAELDRNTPTLMNLRGQRWYGWDGGADSLWSQALKPIEGADEMASDRRAAVSLLATDPALRAGYEAVFGEPPDPSGPPGLSRSFANLGKMFGSKPGFYLLTGPAFEGNIPEGINEVFTSKTNTGFICPRVFLDDTAEDRKAIQSLISQMDVYPLSEFDRTMKTRDWTKVPDFPAPPAQPGGGEAPKVHPDNFFDDLPAQDCPIVAPERRLAGQQLKQRHSQRIDVGPLVDNIALPLDLLGTHVPQRAQHVAGHRHPDVTAGHRQSKISDPQLSRAVD